MKTQAIMDRTGTKRDHPLLSYLALFTSLGTLLCCALPSLLVLLGLGATVVSLISAAPWLVMLTRHKVWVFAISGALIAGNFVYLHWLSPRLKSRGQACSIEDGPTACDTATRVSRVALWVAVAIYGIGFLTAYVVSPILVRLG